jgi:hypothetical protein
MLSRKPTRIATRAEAGALLGSLRGTRPCTRHPGRLAVAHAYRHHPAVAIALLCDECIRKTQPQGSASFAAAF